MPNFTKEQQQAIFESGKNIIVSAGAGSGKTAVLSERVLEKIKSGVNISNLLILTFTNLAAKEMKERIRKKIKKIPELKDQLNKLDSSYITTFDSYSLSVLKKYHYLLNIDKNVSIIDKNILDIKVASFIDEIFLEKYTNDDKYFCKLINDFCIKDDDMIKREIISLNNKLNMRYDKHEYLTNLLNNYNDTYIDARINEYVLLIKNKVKAVQETLLKLYDYCDSDYVDNCYELLEVLFKGNDYNEFLCIHQIKLPNLKRGSQEEAKDIKAKLKNLLDDIKVYMRFSNSDAIKKTIYSTKDYLIAIIDIINLLDVRLDTYKKNNDLYDFVDISKLAIKIVKENTEIREAIKYHFQEILVDEYQDTSDLQEEFINLIANNNVYMVGDIKQSIYRFRNANPYIFKDKYDSYSENKGGMKIDLLKNFRSRKEVLESINLLFEYILDNEIGGADYRKSHEMIFGNQTYIEEGKTNQNYQLEIYQYDYLKELGFNKNEIEAFIIANDIKNKINSHYQVFDKDLKILRDIKYEDFVILVDRSTPFDLYKKIFLYCQIPLNIFRDEYLNQSSDLIVMRHIFKLLKLVKQNIYNKEYIYSFLSIGRSFLFNYSDEDLFNIIRNKQTKNTEIIQKIEIVLKEIDLLSLNEIIDLIIKNFSYYDKLLTISNVKESMVRIDYLYKLAADFSKLGYSYLEFADYMESIFTNNLDIRFSLDNNSGNCVKIMTIHKSKGLEYHICYYPCLYPKFNESDLKENFVYDKELGIITPYLDEGIGKSFYKDLFQNKYKQEEISEKIRLFYVSLTRAKEKIILIAPNETQEEEYTDSIVNNNIRLNYNSFLSMLKSIKSKLVNYIVPIDLKKINLTKDYNIINNNNLFQQIKEEKREIVINVPKMDLKKEIKKSHYSSDDIHIIDKEMQEKLSFGTHMHYLLELIDFKNPKIDELNLNKEEYQYINTFLHSDLLKNIHQAKVYKEYAFIINKGEIIKQGIIDLMLEYDQYIDIIDYKLKNIIKDDYIKQLRGYKEYIEEKTKKKVNLYLYSIIDGLYKKL